MNAYGPPVLIGCCGWAGARRKYFDSFPAVELQTTFYQPPSAELAAKWRSEAPPEFLFSLKAWQLITHTPASPTYRRLKNPVPADRHNAYGSFRPTGEVRAAWDQTLGVARALRASAIVFQCPASFRPTEENRNNLTAFFRSIEREGRLTVWEPRGEWNAAVVRELCEDLDLVHCVDPFQAEPVWGKVVYFRLHGRGGYHYRYEDGELERLRNACLAFQKPVWVMFNNYSMREDASRLKRLMHSR